MEYVFYAIGIFFVFVMSTVIGEALEIDNPFLAFLIGAIIWIIWVYITEIVFFPNSEFIY